MRPADAQVSRRLMFMLPFLALAACSSDTGEPPLDGGVSDAADVQGDGATDIAIPREDIVDPADVVVPDADAVIPDDTTVDLDAVTDVVDTDAADVANDTTDTSDTVDLDAADVPDVIIDPTCTGNPRLDADGDGVCDADDICAEGDDNLDTDGDGTPNACEVCDAGPDADSDGVPDACDTCPGGPDGADDDGDGVCDFLDACPGGIDGADADRDGVCDLLDQCRGGDDFADADTDGVCDLNDRCPGGPDGADADADGVCDFLDSCPGGRDSADADLDGVCDFLDRCPGGNDAADADADGVCDTRDQCLGSDASGDTDNDDICNDRDTCAGGLDTADGDGDGVCDALDRCPGGIDSADADSDGVCDALDNCRGNDASGDSDNDNICNDRDVCAGGLDTQDADADGICDFLDRCAGGLDTADADSDGICDFRDTCPGGLDTADADGDRVCDFLDLCVGNDASGDTDGDDVCNNRDICPGIDDASEACLLTNSPRRNLPVEEVVTTCRTLTATSTGETCQVTAAGTSGVRLRGEVLTPEGRLVGGEVLVNAAGAITCVGCDCSGAAGASLATVVSCPTGVISPGLINAHDHITFTQNAPVAGGAERYDHRHDWRTGANDHTRLSVSGSATTAQIQLGELRQLFTGTTSIAGSGGANGALRNLDRSATQQGGINQDPVEYSTFPLGDTSGLQLATGCGYPSYDPSSSLDADCYLPHIAEGIDEFARNEFVCLNGATGGTDLVEGNTAIVHAIALNAADGSAIAGEGASVVWSPRSNISLYGHTTPVTMFHNQGVRVALGTDWTATGSASITRELACAADYNERYLDGFFSERELWLMATQRAAEALAVDDVIGALRTGLVADIAVFERGASATAYRAVIDGDAGRVGLVLRGGVPIYGDAVLVAALPGTSCETLSQCGESKRVCATADVGATYASLLTAAGATTYSTAICGTPAGEPTCVPSRTEDTAAGSNLYTGVLSASDSDGDGILNTVDNCPAIFNPIRPVDGGVQADADSDGDGDLCDPCPQAADSRSCEPPDPDDVDADGFENVVDNCPDVANPTQADADSDGKGDVCDACPTRSNPGTAACPSSIYEVRQTVAAGTTVSVEGVVTARRGNAFFLQVPTTATEYTTARFSGLYVFIDSTNSAGLTIPTAGRRVRVQGTAADFFGQRQLAQISSITDLGSGTIPAPVTVTTAAVTTAGADADDYEAVLVRVASASVTTKTVTSGPGDVASNNEYLLNGELRVDDAIYNSYLSVNIGDTLSVTGPLILANGNTKILPRSSDDVVGGTGGGVVEFPECLIISEYVEGSGQNKAVEILNCGTTEANLTGVRLALQTNTSSGNTINNAYDFTQTLAAGEVLVICGSATPILPELSALCDVRSNVASFNGDDRLMLYGEDDEASGYTPGADITYDSFGEWGVAPSTIPWANVTYRRCVSTAPHLGGPFDVLTYFTGLPSDTFTGLGSAPTSDCL